MSAGSAHPLQLRRDAGLHEADHRAGIPETLEAIQAELIEDPERWPVVRGLHGARKGRVADPKSPRGKSGSFRYLYLYLPYAGRIHLLFLFAKNEQSDLSPAQAKAFGQLVAKIKEEASRDQEEGC